MLRGNRALVLNWCSGSDLWYQTQYREGKVWGWPFSSFHMRLCIYLPYLYIDFEQYCHQYNATDQLCTIFIRMIKSNQPFHYHYYYYFWKSWTTVQTKKAPVFLLSPSNANGFDQHGPCVPTPLTETPLSHLAHSALPQSEHIVLNWKKRRHALQTPCPLRARTERERGRGEKKKKKEATREGTFPHPLLHHWRVVVYGKKQDHISESDNKSAEAGQQAREGWLCHSDCLCVLFFFFTCQLPCAYTFAWRVNMLTGDTRRLQHV